MVLNIFKEKGWTSFDVVAKVKSILKKKNSRVKVGHAGTLDPLAKGVLIVLTDEDTKRQSEFMRLKKEYVAEISFGVTSPTYDLEGELTYHTISDKTGLKTKLERALIKYQGEIKQRVPPYSAVKKDGKRLYKEARKGRIEEKDLPVRKVSINNLELIDFYEKDNLPTANLKITCGKGTYIRSLAHDLGEDLETGAVLVNLVRTKVGSYKAEDSIRTSELENYFADGDKS